MDYQRHERFAAANQELSQFLQRVDGLATGTESITERDVKALSQRISMLAPEVGDASRGETLDGEIQEEIAEYVTNFRALQSSLEKVRCVMLARRLQLDGGKCHPNGLQEWVDAYSQTR